MDGLMVGLGEVEGKRNVDTHALEVLAVIEVFSTGIYVKIWVSRA